MKDTDLPLTLHPSKWSAIWLLLGCSGFVALSVWMADRGEWMGTLGAVFFGLGIPVAILQLLPGSTLLRLDASGFTTVSLYRKSFVPWSAVDHFCVLTMRQTGLKVREMVGFDFRVESDGSAGRATSQEGMGTRPGSHRQFVPTTDRSKFGRSLARAIAGCEGALPHTYGLCAEELAALLTKWLEESRSRG